MSTARLLFLSPKETVIWRRTGKAYIASDTASTNKWCLTAILLSEASGLEGKVMCNRLKLLELELMDTASSNKRQKDQRREPGEDHGGDGLRGDDALAGGCNHPLWRGRAAGGDAGRVGAAGQPHRVVRSGITNSGDPTALADALRLSRLSPSTPHPPDLLVSGCCAWSYQHAFRAWYILLPLMATTKGGKRATEAAQDANNWNILERLILSQALYQHGVDNLPSVVTLMSSHPMLSRPKNFFSVKVSYYWPLSQHVLTEVVGLNLSRVQLFTKN